MTNAVINMLGCIENVLGFSLTLNYVQIQRLQSECKDMPRSQPFAQPLNKEKQVFLKMGTFIVFP